MGGESSKAEKIAGLRDALRALPKEPGAQRLSTKRDHVRALASELKEARRLGYTLQELSDVLESRGFKIGAAMLGQYLRQQPESITTKAGAGRKEKQTKQSDAPSPAPARKKAVVATRPQPPSNGSTDVSPARTPETPGRTNQAVPAARTPRQSGNIGDKAQPQPRGIATSSGGFTARPDSEDI